MDYVVVVHRAEEGGYWAEVPALEGCYGQGESLEEVLDDMSEAIRSHLDALAELGESAPAGGVLIATVSVPEQPAA